MNAFVVRLPRLAARAALMWRGEVDPAKDELILRDSWGVRRVIRWADVTGWKKRRFSGDVLICSRIKSFTIGS